MLFYHFGVGSEHADIAHHICHHLLESIRLLSLHYFYNVSLHHISALLIDLLGLLSFFGSGFSRFLLDLLLRNQVASDGGLREFSIHCNLLVLTEDWLIHFFHQDFNFGLAKFSHGYVKQLWRELRLLLDLRASKFFSFIEETKDGCLESVGNQLILLWGVSQLQFNLAIAIEPRQSTV